MTPDTPAVQVVSEPRVYDEASPHSFFVDMARTSIRGDHIARERLNRHALEQRVDQGLESRAPATTATGAGGEFAPPTWVISKFQLAARAGRVLGDLVTTLPLPAGTPSVHIPKMTTGADAGIQPAQPSPIAKVDEVTTDAGADGNIVTISGDVDAALQLLDLVPSPPGYDGIVYADLSSAYNQTLEKQMLNGSGSNGQLTGLLKVPNIVTVNGASVSTTQNTMVTNLWTLLGQAAAIVGTGRQLPPQIMVMTPRRFYAIASAEDTSARPIASPGQGPHPNDMPMAGGGLPVGPIIGIPCYLSGGIIGATATNADYVIVARVSDMLLYESDPKFAVALNPLSSSLEVRLQLRRYVAFLNFKPSSISAVINIPQPTNF